MQVSSFHFGPHKTPTVVKTFLILTCALSLLSPLASFFLEHFFHMTGPQTWLPLSLLGIFKGWIWQPATYFFINSLGNHISLSLLFSLLFYLFLFWFTGSEIAVRFGTSRFLLLYIGGGIVSGLVALLFLFLFSSSAVVVGSTPAVFALLTAWMMLYPNLDFHLFIFLRLKAKWLVGIIFGLSLLSTLLHGAYFSLVAELTGILWGLIIGWTVFKTKPYRSPIQKQRRNVWADFPAKKHTSSAQEKVIDISSFQQEDDDAFMDRMLDKISREGELSLTQKEKKRMQDISRKKHL